MPSRPFLVDVGEPGTSVAPPSSRWSGGRRQEAVLAGLELAPLGSDRTLLTFLGRAAVPDRGPDTRRRRVIQAMMRSYLVRLAHNIDLPAGFVVVCDPPRQLPLAGWVRARAYGTVPPIGRYPPRHGPPG